MPSGPGGSGNIELNKTHLAKSKCFNVCMCQFKPFYKGCVSEGGFKFMANACILCTRCQAFSSIVGVGEWRIPLPVSELFKGLPGGGVVSGYGSF